MQKKKPYVSPTVITVKLEPTQAILSQCSVGITDLKNLQPSGTCEGGTKPCKQAGHGSGTAATS